MKSGFRYSSAIGLSIVMALTGCFIVSSRADQPVADQRNLISEVRVDQDDINAGRVAFEDLFYAGKHIFSNRFTSEDHYGEGPEGPRRSKQVFNDRENYPFLRFNGLDAQSCLECHMAVGFAPQQNYPDDGSNMRFAKQLGFTGGSAGFASNAFGLTNFACDPTNVECDKDFSTRGFVRNPPHTFGAGYVQTLAEEISGELWSQLEVARSNPGTTVALTAKGVEFGSISVDEQGNVDLSKVTGVSEDLIVRPFQWRGIAQNLRNFVRDAMNFHFSVQPSEFLRENPEENDMDGKEDEILEGEITAVTTFLAFIRPPVESSDGLNGDQVAQGKAAFAKAGCESCHKPTLTIDVPYASIRDPRFDENFESLVQMQLPSVNVKAFRASSEHGTRFITHPSRFSPTLQKIRAKDDSGDFKSLQYSSEAPQQSGMKISNAVDSEPTFFSRNLNLDDGPPETLPRLASEANGSVRVPLYSDLKRHKMGTNLAEPFTQMTDGGHDIAGDVFLTRPLWGVADTGPWLHDGRALTLTEAIMMHRGEGSEANDSIDLFEKTLSDAERRALKIFLSSLRLPTMR